MSVPPAVSYTGFALGAVGTGITVAGLGLAVYKRTAIMGYFHSLAAGRALNPQQEAELGRVAQENPRAIVEAEEEQDQAGNPQGAENIDRVARRYANQGALPSRAQIRERGSRSGTNSSASSVVAAPQAESSESKWRKAVDMLNDAVSRGHIAPAPDREGTQAHTNWVMGHLKALREKAAQARAAPFLNQGQPGSSRGATSGYQG